MPMPGSFTITTAHLEAFSRQQTQRFEDEMIAYLRQEFPAACAKWSEADLRALIQHGILTARGYNILLEPDVARYIEFMVTLSTDFDRSDQTPWAQPILIRCREPASARLDALAQERDRQLFPDQTPRSPCWPAHSEPDAAEATADSFFIPPSPPGGHP